MQEFDSGIIERYAADLHRRATGRVNRGVVTGGLVGAAAGAFPFFHVVNTTLPHRYWYALIVAGLAAGLYIGYAVGESRAVGLRLQAQLALHQLRIEEMLTSRIQAPPQPVAAPAPEHAPPAMAAFPAEPPVSAVS
jgi:hypothetical protein